MKKFNWNEIEENKGYENVTPGGYICIITAVHDEPEKEYLILEYDIADGNFKGYYRNLYDAKGFWGASFIRSYKQKALGFFKSFLKAVEQSNKGFIADKFDGDESKLKGKYVGLVLAEEEYKGKDDTVKTRLYVSQILPACEIKNGKFMVPALKPLENKTNDPFATITAADTTGEKLPWE